MVAELCEDANQVVDLLCAAAMREREDNSKTHSLAHRQNVLPRVPDAQNNATSYSAVQMWQIAVVRRRMINTSKSTLMRDRQLCRRWVGEEREGERK